MLGAVRQQWIGSGSDQALGKNRSSCRRRPGLGWRKLSLKRTVPVRSACIFIRRYAAAGVGSGLTNTVSTTGTISVAGISAAAACARIASGLSAW